MQLTAQIAGTDYIVGQAHDISLPISTELARAFDARPPFFGLYQDSGGGQFDLSVAKKQSCNCGEITFNPHCHGTHTETYDHITAKNGLNPINDVTAIIENHLATVLTFDREGGENLAQGDRVIGKDIMQHAIDTVGIQPGVTSAVVIRTLPNTIEKKSKNRTKTNPPYVLPEAMDYLVEIGIEHLVLDMPSVDREVSHGKTPAHTAWWQMETYPVHMPDHPRKNATITELAYIHDDIKNGQYLLNLGVAPIVGIDVAPSRPTLRSLTVQK